MTRLRAQDGFAIPVVLGLLLVLLSLGAVVVLEATAANENVQRDTRVKRAVAAAGAGVDAALWRMNTFTDVASDPSLGLSTCLASAAVGSGPAVPGVTVDVAVQVGSGYWCPPVTEELGNGESFTYRVSAIVGVDEDLGTIGPGSSIERTIVSWGTVGAGADQVTRRVAVEARAFNAARLFYDYAVVSEQDLVIGTHDGLSPTTITGGLRTDGDVTLEESAAVCGNIRYRGTIDDQSGGLTCSGAGVTVEQTGENLVLDPVTAPAANDNGAICPLGVLSCSLLGVTWDPTARTLEINGGTLTVVGQVFDLCGLTMRGNAAFEITPPDATKPVIVFLDDCDTNAPQTVLAIGGQARFVTAGLLEFHVEGDDTAAFTEGIAGTPIVAQVYAPRGTVTVTDEVEIVGGIAARSASVSGGASVAQAQVPSVISVDVSPQFRRERFVECTGVVPGATQDPDVAC